MFSCVFSMCLLCVFNVFSYYFRMCSLTTGMVYALCCHDEIPVHPKYPQLFGFALALRNVTSELRARGLWHEWVCEFRYKVSIVCVLLPYIYIYIVMYIYIYIYIYAHKHTHNHCCSGRNSQKSVSWFIYYSKWGFEKVLSIVTFNSKGTGSHWLVRVRGV